MSSGRYASRFICLLSFGATLCPTEPAPGQTYTNPVLPASFASPACADDDARGCEFADPGVVKTGEGWLVATTTIDGDDVYALHASQDLARWTARGHVWPRGAPGRPAWANGSWYAPELHHVNGTWLLVFSARHGATGKQAVGIAVSTSGMPSGPYQDLGDPVLPDDSNDPTLATDNDRTFLVWKQKRPDRIFARELSLDAMALTWLGEPRLWLNVSAEWEYGVVEAPWLVSQGEWWYLFYAGDFNKNVMPPDHKGVGCARSRTLHSASWEKYSTPLLHSRGGGRAPFLSPGHPSVVRHAAAWYMVYHASRNSTNVAGPREMMLDKLLFGTDGWPRVATPDAAPSDVPTAVPDAAVAV